MGMMVDGGLHAPIPLAVIEKAPDRHGGTSPTDPPMGRARLGYRG